MLRVTSIMVAVFLFCGVSLAQEQRERKEDRSYDADYSRPQTLGLGAALSLNRFAGDLQDGSNFPGAETDWGIGGNIHLLWRFADAGDFATLHLLGRVAYSPVSSSFSGRRYTFEYSDDLLHFIAALQMQFFPEYDLRPYAYAGFGYLAFSPEITPTGFSKNSTGDETGSITLPLGVGLAWTISERLDFSAEFMKTLTFSDEMDNWVSEVNDNYNMVSFGLTFYLAERSEPVQPEARSRSPRKTATTMACSMKTRSRYTTRIPRIPILTATACETVKRSTAIRRIRRSVTRTMTGSSTVRK